ncbi:MAG: extensin family protein [Hyphomicrobiaceae bacterium]
MLWAVGGYRWVGLWRWASRLCLCLVFAIGIGIVFRQGWIPARYTPLPKLDLARTFPILVDWQLAELRSDRELCRAVTEKSPHIKSRVARSRPIVGGCGWTNALRVREIGGAKIGIRRVSCEVGAALALWMTHDVQPLALKIFGKRIAHVQNFGTYSCRNIVGSRFWKTRRSQHATANAIDISGFRLSDGTRISVLVDWQGSRKKSQFLRAIHQRACKYFRVALSPDFNRAHRDHFHFDRGMLSTCR